MDEQTQQELTQEFNGDTQENKAPAENPEDEPEIGLTDDGDLQIRDDFYGYDEDEQTQEQQSRPDWQANTGAPEQPVFYTQEELKQVPFEQWDKAKLPKEVASYYDAVAQQIALRQQAAQRQQQVQNISLTDGLGEAPKPFTPKELAQAAREAAMKQLNIQDASDFEPDYDEEQRAALDMARMDLLQQRQYETARYNQRLQERADLQRFNQKVIALPDYNEFNQWYLNTLQRVGKTEADINMALARLEAEHGGRAVIQQVFDWYQMYRAERQSELAKKNIHLSPQSRRKAAPPTLESSRGGDSVISSRSGFDGKAFSRMTPEQQQQAFIDMGLV